MFKLEDPSVQQELTDVQVSQDDRFLLLATMDSKIVVWDLRSRSRVVALIEHSRGVRSIALSSDDRFLVSCGGD